MAKMLTFVKPCGKNGHHCYQTHRPRLPHFFNGNVLKCHLVLGPDYGGDRKPEQPLEETLEFLMDSTVDLKMQPTL